MRSEEEIKKIILNKANADERIRAVLLNGSRANNKISPDKYQDFDIVYVVTTLESFICDHSWTNFFGDRIIWQLPDKMDFGKTGTHDTDKIGFHYLMLFKDKNRIDLTLLPADKIEKEFQPDSLTIVLLDKDNLFSGTSVPTDNDYLIRRPTNIEFLDTCNEFWWITTYVVKGLLRNELTYSKEILESVGRPMFMKVIEWKIGIENNFTVSFGKGGRFMKQYLTNIGYEKILITYSGHEIEKNWESLFTMTGLFGDFAKEIAEKLNFKYNTDDEQNVKLYLKQMYDEQSLTTS